ASDVKQSRGRPEFSRCNLQQRRVRRGTDKAFHRVRLVPRRITHGGAISVIDPVAASLEFECSPRSALVCWRSDTASTAATAQTGRQALRWSSATSLTKGADSSSDERGYGRHVSRT